jgi:hypothetical protein
LLGRVLMRAIVRVKRYAVDQGCIIGLIGSDATLYRGSGSPGQLQEVGINNIDYETSNDLYDGDIVYSVMLCV